MTAESDFNTFWAAYPRRVAKGHAREMFAKAIRKTTLQTMLAAIEAYIKHKPDRIDFKHPATWLRAESWDDEWHNAPRETGRKRTFTDVAMDRFNHGSASVQGSGSNVGVVPANQWEPGPDDQRIRIGSDWHGVASRH